MGVTTPTTPTEALAQATHHEAHAPYCSCRAIEIYREHAPAILAALHEGWMLIQHGPEQERERLAALDYMMGVGAAQERERLRALNEASPLSRDSAIRMYVRVLLADPEPAP